MIRTSNPDPVIPPAPELPEPAGPALSYDQRINIAGDGGVYLDTNNDWRGRELSIRIHSDATGGYPDDAAPWLDSLPGGGRTDAVVGHNASSDAIVFGASTGAAYFQVIVEGSTGHLKLDISSYVGTHDIRIIIDATGQTTETAFFYP